jgi:hypothetical protein
MDQDPLWYSLGGGVLIAAALTFARLVLEHGVPRPPGPPEPRPARSRRRAADARLERLLQERLAEADRRLERCELDRYTERVRAAALEHEHARLRQAYELLKAQHALLEAASGARAEPSRKPRFPLARR